MKYKQKEKIIYELLLFMKESIENKGYGVGNVYFDFSPKETLSYISKHPPENISAGEDFVEFKNKHRKIKYKEFQNIVNITKSRDYIETMVYSSHFKTQRNQGVCCRLTDLGFSIAIEFEKYKNRPLFVKISEWLSDRKGIFNLLAIIISIIALIISYLK